MRRLALFVGCVLVASCADVMPTQALRADGTAAYARKGPPEPPDTIIVIPPCDPLPIDTVIVGTDTLLLFACTTAQ